MHLHVHVIPRYHGDVDDPRGGVRGVIPGRQKYDPSKPPEEDVDPFAGLDPFVPGEDDGHLLPAIQRAMRVADEIDIVAAFIQKTGVELLEGDLVDALVRQAKIRILTGDYLGITHPHALQRLYTLTTDHPGLQVRLYRVAKNQAFHPKAYIFLRGPHGAAFVGSSNLSRSALTSGVEWNLRSTHRDPATFRAIRRRFDRLFHAHPQSVELTAEVVATYQHTVRVSPQPEPAAPPPEPHAIQQEVLRCLRRTREEGFARGLVVMATGLGKTFLAAFDFLHHGGRRALFVAHREEILRQAADAWARVLPDRSIGFLTGGEKTPEAEILFASIFTIAKARHLHGFSPEHFDYVVVDEFHHAAATSYRRLLAHFSPKFMLGLTATPDRADGAALLELCDDNLVARVGLLEGIARGLLVPFHYHGVRDAIDFAAIPWRSGRFDEEALTAAAATRENAAQALREYQRHAPGPRRSLIFCCSVAHADFIAKYFVEHGIAAVAVHSGSTTAPRAARRTTSKRQEAAGADRLCQDRERSLVCVQMTPREIVELVCRQDGVAILNRAHHQTDTDPRIKTMAGRSPADHPKDAIGELQLHDKIFTHRLSVLSKIFEILRYVRDPICEAGMRIWEQWAFADPGMLALSEVDCEISRNATADKVSGVEFQRIKGDTFVTKSFRLSDRGHD